MSRRVARIGLVLAVFSSLILGGTGSARAIATCVYEPAKTQVVVTLQPAATSSTVLSIGTASTILVDGSTCSSGATDATLKNTSLIRVTGTGNDDLLKIDESGGNFGAIGWVVDLSDGSLDQVWVVGEGETGPPDTMIVGSIGFSLGSSSGTHAGVEAFSLDGRGGPDWLSAAGGTAATGSAYTGGTALVGGDGDDLLMGGAGSDSLRGGPGRDLVSYAGRSEDLELSADGVADDGTATEFDNILSNVEAVLGGSGDDVIEMPTATAASLSASQYCSSVLGATLPEACGGPGSDTFPDPVGGSISGGSEVDTADWSAHPGGILIGGDLLGVTARVDDDVEVLIGSDYLDHIHAGDGPNTLIGGGGRDYLNGGLGADELIGGPGNDWAQYASHSVEVTVSLDGVANDGIAGEDSVAADIENVTGGSGADHLIGNSSKNKLEGGVGDDLLEGGGGQDVLRGQQGADELLGGDGNDVLVGDISGGPGFADDLNGGPGNDLLDGGLGADVMSGDAGSRDKVTYEDRVARVTVTLRGGDDDGEAGEGDFVGSDVEWVLGGSGDDEFVSASRGPAAGIAADNVFVGNGGNDELKGGNGRDTLNGGDGNDTLLGGDGADVLRGDRNIDTIKGEGGADRIYGGENGDELKGNSGNDTFFADDGWEDDVIGGAGTDTAHVDVLDDVRSCENVD